MKIIIGVLTVVCSGSAWLGTASAGDTVRSEYTSAGSKTRSRMLINEPEARTEDPKAAVSERQVHIPAQPSLADLERLAKQFNPTLIEGKAQVEGNLAKAWEAGLYPNPVIGYTGEQIGVENTPGEFQGGFVEQEIVTAGKLRLSRDKYLARADAARQIERAQWYRVLNDVRIHYYRVLGARQVVEVQEQMVKTANDNLVTLREMFNVGQANEADIHDGKANLKREQLTLQMAQNQLLEAKERLSAIVGIDLGYRPLQGNLDGQGVKLQWESSLERLLAESPELAQAQAKLRADQITLEREEVQAVPNIFVRGAAGYNYEAKETTYAAELRMELPIFDWNQGTIEQARVDLYRQEAEVQRTKLALRDHLAREYRRYETALQHVEGYRDVIVPELVQAYDVRLKSYKSRRGTWPDVLRSQEKLYRARISYIRNLVTWREAEVAINGLLLIDGLRAPQGVTPPGHIDSVPKPR